MKVDFEYGKGVMSAELPSNTDVFIPGEKQSKIPHLSHSIR